jgi:hypothetical protein
MSLNLLFIVILNTYKREKPFQGFTSSAFIFRFAFTVAGNIFFELVVNTANVITIIVTICTPPSRQCVVVILS